MLHRLRTPDSSTPPTRTRTQRDEALDALLHRTAVGDREAFARLYDATCGAVFGLATASTDDAAAAESATLRAYLRVWQSAPDYPRRGGSALSWIRAITAQEIGERPRVMAVERAT